MTSCSLKFDYDGKTTRIIRCVYWLLDSWYNHITHTYLSTEYHTNSGTKNQKWVNPNDIQYGVNSLRLGGLHLIHEIFILP